MPTPADTTLSPTVLRGRDVLVGALAGAAVTAALAFCAARMGWLPAAIAPPSGQAQAQATPTPPGMVLQPGLATHKFRWTRPDDQCDAAAVAVAASLAGQVVKPDAAQGNPTIRVGGTGVIILCASRTVLALSDGENDDTARQLADIAAQRMDSVGQAK